MHTCLIFFLILDRDLGIVFLMYVSMLMLVNGSSVRYLIRFSVTVLDELVYEFKSPVNSSTLILPNGVK